MSAAVFEPKAAAALATLGLTTAHGRLDAVAQQAAAGQWSYSHFLGRLLDDELAERHRRTVALNLQFARFPAEKRLRDFDFQAQPSLDPKLIDELATGRYLAEGRNIVLLGPPGVGKTHLAIGLGVACAEMGHRVYFTNAVDAARRLSLALAEWSNSPGDTLSRRTRFIGRELCLLPAALSIDSVRTRIAARFVKSQDLTSFAWPARA